jgi:hypothetical protein
MVKLVALKVPDEVYEELKRRSLEQGYTLVADYVRDLLLACIRGALQPGVRGLGDVRRIVEEVVRESVRELTEDRIVARLERKLQDMLNPWTAKIDSIASRLATVIERVEAIEDKVSKLEEKLKEVEERASEHVAPPPRARRRSAIERLKEQGIVFESEVQWLRDRDAFFERLRREGALILNIGGERVAVDKQFWSNFVDKVEKLPTPNDDEVRVLLTEPQYRLFRKLKEAGLVYFDSSEKRWKFVEKPS